MPAAVAHIDFPPGWSERFYAPIEYIEDVCHMLLDLFISLSPLTFTSPTSPAEPASTSASASAPSSSSTARPNTDFTQVKIRLREIEAADAASRPPKKRSRISTGKDVLDGAEKTDFLGRDDVTVRFLFEPGR
jgi:CTD kinase subunit beta